MPRARVRRRTSRSRFRPAADLAFRRTRAGCGLAADATRFRAIRTIPAACRFRRMAILPSGRGRAECRGVRRRGVRRFRGRTLIVADARLPRNRRRRPHIREGTRTGRAPGRAASIAHPDTLAPLRKVLPPYSVNICAVRRSRPRSATGTTSRGTSRRPANRARDLRLVRGERIPLLAERRRTSC